MNKLTIWVVILILLGGTFWFINKNDAPKETGPIKIGVSLPLTGEAASLGEQMKLGIDFARDEINAAGGIGGRMVELVYEDDKCSSAGANTFQKLTSIDKVAAIVGPLCSAAAGPGTPIAESSKTPTIIFGSAPPLTIGKDYVFRSYPSDSFQGKFAAEYIFNSLGNKKVALVYVKNDWGQGLHDVFAQKFTELGGEVVVDEGVPQDARDLRTIFTKVKNSGAEIIYMPLYPATAVSAVKEIKALGIKLKVFGGDTLEADEFLRVPESEGVTLTTASLANPEEFKSRVKEKTGKDGSVWTAIAYDTLNVMAEAVKESGTDPEKIIGALQKISHKGISIDPISFDSEGDLAQAKFDLKIVRGGKLEILK